MKEMKNTGMKSIRIALEYILILFVILECNSVYRCVYERTDTVYQSEVTMVWLGVLLTAVLILEDKTRLRGVFESAVLLFPIMAIEIFFLAFNVLKTGAIANYVLNFIVLFPIAVLIFKIYWQMDSPSRLLYVMSDVVIVIAILSLISWGLVLMGVLQPSGTITIDWGGVKEKSNWFNFLFNPQYQEIPLVGIYTLRNTGIFPEAPMYNIFLNAAFFTEMFLKKKNNWVRIVIFTITVFTTLGILGIILNMIGYAVKLSQFLIKKNKKIGVPIVGAVTVAAAVILALDKRDFDYGSYGVHIDDFVASFKAWTQNWFMGCGYENESFIQQYMSDWRMGNPGLSNSIGPVLAEGGIVLMLFYLLPFGTIIYSGIKSKRRDVSCFAVMVFAIFVVTIFHYRYFALVLLAFGYSFISISWEGEKIKFSCIFDEAKIDTLREEPGDSKVGVYVFASLASLSILLCALNGHFYNFAVSIYDRYSLALEKNQWRFVVVVCVAIFILSLVTQGIELCKYKKTEK